MLGKCLRQTAQTHQWLGRAIALLAFAQIPIGLTLYGSPIYLFILYTFWMLGLLILFFILTFQRQKRVGLSDDDRGSYSTGSRTETTYDRRHDRHTEKQTVKRGANKTSRLEALGGAFAGGLGVEALRHRYLQRRQRDRRSSRASDSRHDNKSRTDSVHEAKSSSAGDRNSHKRSWRDRLLGDRQSRHDDWRYSEERWERRQEEPSEASALGVARLEEGRLLPKDDDHWQEVERREAAQAAAERNSEDQSARAHPQQSNAPARTPSGRTRLQKRRSRDSTHAEHDERSTVDSPASDSGYTNIDTTGLAALPLVGAYFQRQRRKKELQRRHSQRQREYETRRLYSQHYVEGNRGAVLPPDSQINDFGGEPQRQHQPQQNAYPVPPYLQTPAPPPPPALRQQEQQQQQQQQLPPPTSPNAVHLSPNQRTRPSRVAAGANHAPATNSLHVRVAPGGPPAVITLLKHHGPADNTPSASAAPSELVPLGAGAPVAVKVKVHPDGRHVTLRRVDAAADGAPAGASRAAGAGGGRESSGSGSEATGEMRREGYRRSQSHGAAGRAQRPYQDATPYPRLSQYEPPMPSGAGAPAPPPARPVHAQPPYPSSPPEPTQPQPPYLRPQPHYQQQQQPQARTSPSHDYPPPPPFAPPQTSSPRFDRGGADTAAAGQGQGNDVTASPPTTDTSAAYESSRRRRRAERARVAQGTSGAGGGGGGGARVSFG